MRVGPLGFLTRPLASVGIKSGIDGVPQSGRSQVGCGTQSSNTKIYNFYDINCIVLTSFKVVDNCVSLGHLGFMRRYRLYKRIKIIAGVL